MTTGKSGANPGESSIQDAIDEYLDRSIESGRYRENARMVLNEWDDWLDTEHHVSDLAEVDVLVCRQYARHLKTQVTDGEFKPSTARTYYAIIRAFLSFCEADELIDGNPAKAHRATEELPENPGDVDRQFWSADARQTLLEYVDERVKRALDGDVDISRDYAYRDRAIVYLLALSGVRGAEVFAVSSDDRRNGITWNDVDLADGAVRVLGKSRKYEYAQLPERAASALDRYNRVMDPPSEEWPVFPTEHAPSKYSAVRDQLATDHPSDEIERILEENPIDEILREYAVVPPALTTNGARAVMQRLCETADISVDGDYLKPHGARRGLGHELYAKGHAELAQAALRHASIETTHESYSDIRAGDTARRVDDVLDR